MRPRTPNFKFASCAAGSVRTTRAFNSSISPARSGWIAPGRTRVNEHAETGKPLADNRLHGRRGERGAFKLRFFSAVRPCTRTRWNGPGGILPKLVGHKLSAIGLPQHSTRSACFIRHPPWFSAPRGWLPGGSRYVKVFRIIHFAHPLPIRSSASPSLLAAGTGCQRQLDGKVRWQKRFASPARRMRHG